MFQLCFDLNKIHDSVGKALRTSKLQGRATDNLYALSSSSGNVIKREWLLSYFTVTRVRRGQEELNSRTFQGLNSRPCTRKFKEVEISEK